MRIHGPVSPTESTTGQFEDLKKLAYEAGLASGREAGYKQGFQDGFLAYLKNQNASSSSIVQVEGQPSDELTPNGKRLVGPPCLKCGHCYPGSMTHCPRCKTPAEVFHKTPERREDVPAEAVSLPT